MNITASELSAYHQGKYISYMLNNFRQSAVLRIDRVKILDLEEQVKLYLTDQKNDIKVRLYLPYSTRLEIKHSDTEL